SNPPVPADRAYSPVRREVNAYHPMGADFAATSRIFWVYTRGPAGAEVYTRGASGAEFAVPQCRYPMRHLLDTIPSDDALPASADVVVIGGGIAGASAAYWLARRGVSVALLEKGLVGAEQSSRNWGFCRKQGRDHGE